MTDLNEKALEAAVEAWRKSPRGTGVPDAIRAYLEAATPPDVADSEEEARIDNLRLRAFQTNADKDRQAYFDAASKWFQDRHFRRMAAATALRLSAGGGWRTIDSAPHGVNVLLAYWDEALGGWHMEAGMASWGWRHDGVSNMSAHGQATHWRPLPASPTVEDVRTRGTWERAQ